MLALLILVLAVLKCSSASTVYVVAENVVDCEPLGMECHPLQYYVNQSYFITIDAIFQFKGSVHSLTGVIELHQVHNVTLMGLDHDNSIDCTGSEGGITIYNSMNVEIVNIKLFHCQVKCNLESIADKNSLIISHVNFNNTAVCIINASSVTIASFRSDGKLVSYNGLDMNVSSAILCNAVLLYQPLPACSYNIHYYLIITDTIFADAKEQTLKNEYTRGLSLLMNQGRSYHLYVTFDGINSNDFTINMQVYFLNSLSCVVMNNITSYGGRVGLYVSLNDTSMLSDNCTNENITMPPCLLELTNSKIYQNNYGFSMNYWLLVHKEKRTILIKDCLIYNNSHEQDDSAGLTIYADLLDEEPTTHVMNTQMLGNDANAIINLRKIIFTNVTIANSTLTGLLLLQSLISVNGTLNILNNHGRYFAHFGGGITLLEASHIKMFSNSRINFIGNHVVFKGGAIFADSKFSAQCYIRSDKHYDNNIQIILNNNTAGVLGGDVYGIDLKKCSNNIKLIHNDDIDQTTDSQQLCFCTSSSYNECSFEPFEQSVFPGQKVRFSIAQWGYGYSTQYSITDGMIDLYLNGIYVETQSIEPNCTHLSYTPNSTSLAERKAVELIFQNVDQNVDFTKEQIKLFFSILPCPIGFKLSDEANNCTCNEAFSTNFSSKFDEGHYNILCNIETLEMTREGRIWIGPYNITENINIKEPNPDICLINEFCILCDQSSVTFMLNDTDVQCPPYKSGPLCRLCANGSSLLLGYNECGECDNNSNIALIIVFVMMGILLVVLLIVLNLTVSVGTINGLLFAVNALKLYTPVFVGNQVPYRFFHQIIAWLNLDFGIETCFYSGMDRYGKEWLQFVFPFYVWSIMIIIIIAARKSSKVSKLVGTNVVPVLATLLLLSYTKLLSTIVKVFNKQDLTLYCNESSRTITVWYEDPTVIYASGKHLALFLFALLVFIVFCIPYALFLLLIPFVEKYLSKYIKCSYWNKLKPIIDAYCGPMKDEYRFWPGLLLLARIPLLLAVSLVDSVVESHEFLLSILLSILVIIISLAYCLQGVYQKHLHNIIETWFLFILFIMVGFSIINEYTVIWFNVCFAIVVLSLFAICFYHTYLYQWKNIKSIARYVYRKFLVLQHPKKDANLNHIEEIIEVTQNVPPPKTNLLDRDSVTELFEFDEMEEELRSSYCIMQKPD